ncbi:MAG TPA: L,D-transpeptidase [Polyangiaceae bacterium]|nr:L,D-transpeptidase [Polyangiaceae bacterium]
MHQEPRKDPARSPTAGNARVARQAPTPKREKEAPRQSAGSTLLASGVGFAVAASLAGAVAWSSGCRGEPPPGASTDKPSRVSPLPAPAPSPSPSPKTASKGPTPLDARDAGAPDAEAAAAAEPPPDKPYTGPLLGALALQTPVYPTMEFSKRRLGYIRLGGKVPVEPTPVKSTNCQQGWYKLVDGGFVCGKYATPDMTDPRIKLGITAPNLEEVLPYKYAYNTKHGTPLYRSVPSKDEMLKYEPYLEASKRKKKDKKDGEAEENSSKPVASAAPTPAPAPALLGGDDAGAAPAFSPDPADPLGLGPTGAVPSGDSTPSAEEAPPPPAPPKRWWEDNEPGKQPTVTLADLAQDADDTVAKRMVKGFFVAIDKSFGWNSRLWYKTTAGLVAPSDRMYITKPPSSKGIDVPEGVKQIGFITALKASKYEFDEERTKVSVKGSIARFSAVGLTGVTVSHKTVIYRQTTEGWWMKGIDGTFTDPGSPPEGLAPGEKWIDVNLTRKTLVAFEGDKPVYAALVSPGKKSKKKAKDHSTIKGTFRIREKHIAVTMDGDGTVAGDLPYSIEDVPYVAYYDGSYALHGAFWHNNFGHEMSHGCVNLSPLDAKKIFFWSEPRLPRGWHAVWATSENKGTQVVIHE